MKDWIKVCALDDIPLSGSRVVKSARGDIALFRTASDGVFALYDRCPHKAGPLSQGIVLHDTVVCPLHGWHINLEDGQAVAPDVGCAKTVACKVEDGVVFMIAA